MLNRMKIIPALFNLVFDYNSQIVFLPGLK